MVKNATRVGNGHPQCQMIKIRFPQTSKNICKSNSIWTYVSVLTAIQLSLERRKRYIQQLMLFLRKMMININGKPGIILQMIHIVFNEIKVPRLKWSMGTKVTPFYTKADKTLKKEKLEIVSNGLWYQPPLGKIEWMVRDAWALCLNHVSRKLR